MYRREFWEKRPFKDMNDEDEEWLKRPDIKPVVRSQSSLDNGKPRMIATIHPGNTSPKKGARFEKASAELDREVRRCLSASLVAQSH